MLPHLLPPSATDVESDSDSLASPLDASTSISHINIAKHYSRRSLNSPARGISRLAQHIEGARDVYASYHNFAGPFDDVSYEVACNQAAEHDIPVTSPYKQPTCAHSQWDLPTAALALCGSPSHHDVQQYSAVSDSAFQRHDWDYAQDAEYFSDSPTSAVSEPFFRTYNAGAYSDASPAQLPHPSYVYDGNVYHNPVVGSEQMSSNSFSTTEGVVGMTDVFAQRISAHGYEYTHHAQGGGDEQSGSPYDLYQPSNRHNIGAYDGRHSSELVHGNGNHAMHGALSQTIPHIGQPAEFQHPSTLAEPVRPRASHSPTASHGHAVVSPFIPRHDHYVYPPFDHSPSGSPSQQNLPSIHAPQPKPIRPMPMAVPQEYRDGDDVVQPPPMAAPYQVLSIPTAPPPPPPLPMRHSAPVEDTPKKPLTLACFFCRKRKIACGSPPPGKKDRTCNQCARRNLKCVYPEASRRGMRPKLLYDRDMLPMPAIPAILS